VLAHVACSVCPSGMVRVQVASEMMVHHAHAGDSATDSPHGLVALHDSAQSATQAGQMQRAPAELKYLDALP
jgi:hypothetical protein